MDMGHTELTLTAIFLLPIVVGLFFLGSISWYLGKVWALRRVTRNAHKERRVDTNGTTE